MRWTRDEVTVDAVHGWVERGGRRVPLTTKEGELLRYLAQRPGHLVARDTLLQDVWGYHPGTRSRAVDKTFHRLRAKLEADPGQPLWLHALRGEGIRFTPPPVAPVPVQSAPADLPPTHLIGRDAECARLEAWAAGPSELLTLLGMGGIGKTSLARWLARTLSESGQLLGWVDAAGIDGAAGLAEAVGRALGVRNAHSSDVLLEALHEQTGRILVLDDLDAGAEAAAPVVHDWVTRTGVRVLVTSRRRLRLPVEDLLLVESLSPEHSVEVLRRRSRWGDVPELATMARQLEGIPLALELAAAHGPLMPPAVVLQRLERLLAQPPGGGAPGSHRSMAAAIGESWARLDPSEQEALACMAGLPGALGLTLAEVATGRGDALAVLVRLVDASLLRWEDAHLGMFAVVRGFVSGQSHPSIGADARRRVGRWLVTDGLALVDDCSFGMEATEVRALLGSAGLAAVLEQAASDGDTDQLALLTCLWVHETRHAVSALTHTARLEAVLAADGLSLPTRVRTRALCLQTAQRGGVSPVVARLEPRLLAEVDRVPPALASRTWTAWATSDLPGGEGGARQIRALESATLPRHRARLLTSLAGVQAKTERADTAQALFREALDLYRSVGDHHGQAYVDVIRGNRVDSWAEARALHRRLGQHHERLEPCALRDKVTSQWVVWSCELMVPDALPRGRAHLDTLVRTAHWFDAAVVALHLGALETLADHRAVATRHLDNALRWARRVQSDNVRFILTTQARSAVVFGEHARALAGFAESGVVDDDTHAFCWIACAALGRSHDARAHLDRVTAPWVRRILEGERGHDVLEQSVSREWALLLMMALDRR